MLDELDTSGPVAADQRATPRRSALVRCRVTDGVVDRFTRLINVSNGGARIATATPPRVGAKLTVRFVLHEVGPNIIAEAVVVWRAGGFRGRGGLMGVEFASVSHPGEIVRYVNEG